MNIKWMLAVSALAVSTSAFAEEATPAPGASAQNSIGDIVVTARRREESALKVPVAVTAFSADALRSKSINAQEDLVTHTPGLVITSGGGQRDNGSFFIRGQGATYGSQPGVITYMNEVPAYNVSTQGNTAQFFDLSGIQVLKGPQGTLFGRSTTGGAILLTSQRPTNDLGGNLQASYGNYNAVDIQGALNLPLIKDKVLLRVAGDFIRRKGYTVSIPTGQDLDDKHREAFRVSLLVKPVDGIENLFIFSDQSVNEHGGSNVLAEFNQGWSTATPVGTIHPYAAGTTPYQPNEYLASIGALAANLGGTPTPIPPYGDPFTMLAVGGLCEGLNGVPQATQQQFFAGLFNPVIGTCMNSRLGALWGANGLVANSNAELARQAAGGSIRQTAIPQVLNHAYNSQNITNTTTFHQDGVGVLGDITIKNIFATNAVGHDTNSWELSGVGGAYPVNGFVPINGVYTPYAGDTRAFFQNFSDEFQVQGHTKLLDWTVGYYYNFEKVPSQIGPLFGTFGNALDPYAPIPAPAGQFAFNHRTADKGVYAQGTLHPFAGASITAGIRRSNYSETDQNAVLTFNGSTFVPGTLIDANPVNQGATSYNFAADYKPMDGMLIYATTRRGFKPGGANGLPPVNFPAFQLNFQPEILTDYEGGVKYAWRGPIAGRVSLAGFISDYSNIQRNQTYPLAGGSVFTQVQNVAGGRIEGFELESEFRVGPKLTVGLNAAYTSSKYTNWAGCDLQQTCPAGDTNYNVNAPFSNTPKFTWSLNARYLVIDQANIGQVSVSGNYYHQSFTVVDDSYIQDPERVGANTAYGLLNLRADWTNVAGKPFDLFLNATNVTNKVYKVGASNLYAAVGYLALIYGEPRMVTGGVRVHF